MNRQAGIMVRRMTNRGRSLGRAATMENEKGGGRRRQDGSNDKIREVEDGRIKRQEGREEGEEKEGHGRRRCSGIVRLNSIRAKHGS